MSDRKFYSQNGWEGSKYDVYQSTGDVSKLLRQKLKKVFPACKFSITTEYFSMGSAINISLMSAPFDILLKDCKEKHIQVNEYHLEKSERLNDEGKYLFHYILSFVNEYQFRDCDSMTDYFNVKFFLHLNVGKWNKPFIKTNHYK